MTSPTDREPPKFAPFDVLGSERLYDSPWVGLRRDRVRASEDLTFDYHIVEIGDAVCVLPITSGGRVVMIGQYRYPHGKTHWEFPTGRLDAGEAPADGAARELLEETGYVPSELVRLPGFYPLNGISDHWCHLFVALGCESKGPPQLEPSERIEPRVFDADDVEALVRAGNVDDGFSQIAFLRGRLDGHV